jgi:branched-subunit amino acid transport protein
MSTAIAILAVGAVSYVFRVVPLLTVGRLQVGRHLSRTIRHAGAAAVTALFAASLSGGGRHGALDPALVIAVVPSLWLAVRGAPMLRVVGIGAAAYALVAAAAWVVQLGSS